MYSQRLKHDCFDPSVLEQLAVCTFPDTVDMQFILILNLLYFTYEKVRIKSHCNEKKNLAQGNNLCRIVKTKICKTNKKKHFALCYF